MEPLLPTTKTFMEYEELDFYDSYRSTVEVPTRDVKQIDFAKVFPNGAPSFLGFPTKFRFYDADVTTDAQGREVQGAPRNFSKNYVVAEKVMTLHDYRKRELPKIAREKRNKTTMAGRALGEFMDGGFSLKRAFKAALDFGRPVLCWYIQGVEAVIAEAEKRGVKTVSLWDSAAITIAQPVDADTIVLDKSLNQIHPPRAAVAPALKRAV